MVHEGRFDKRLEKTWQEEAKTNEDDSLCKFQYDLKCSGWDVRCPGSNATYNATWSNFTAAQQLNCPDCTGTQYQAQIDDHSITTQTCHQVIKKDVNKYFYILLGVGFGLMALTLLSIVVSCKVRVEYEDYQEMQERF